MRGLKSLLPFLKNYKWRLSLSVLFNILAALFTLISIPLVIPFFQILFGANISAYAAPDSLYDLEGTLNYFFSRLIAISDRPTALSFVCIILVVIVLFRNVFRYLTSFFLIPVRNGVVRDLRQSLMKAFTNLPISYLRSRRKGDLMSISSNDVVEVEWSVIRMMELLFKSPVIILGSLIFMFWINVQLSFIALSLMFVIGVVLGIMSRDLKKKSQETQSILGVLSTQIDDVLSGIKVIKAFGAELFVQSRFDKTNSDHYKMNNKILRKRDLASPLSEFLGVCLVVVLIWYGAKLVLRAEMMPETFFAFVFAFYNVIEPSKTLSSAYYNIQKGLASMERINEVIQDSNGSTIFEGTLGFPENWQKIEFRNVAFQHESQPILKGINLEIVKGQKVAIVGKSGEGKTTILDLLLGFFDPLEGQIRINGTDIKEIKTTSYRSKFGLITQEPILFNATVSENITLGKMTSEDELNYSLKDSDAWDFIRNKKEAIHSDIKDMGVNLSMGERQRIAIARSILHDKEIWLIDEATSSLDAESESEVLSALKSNLSGKTAIIISHKFNLIKDCDIIYVISNGIVVNSGSHVELIEVDGLYKDLLSFQDGNGV